MRKIVLASHGEFSKGLLDSMHMILGEAAKNVVTYSLYPGESAADYAAEIETEIIENATTEYVLISDLFGASVCSALMPLTKYDNVTLFTGMSFHMVTELLLGYEHPLTKDDIEMLVADSRKGIRHVNILDKKEEVEDF